MGYWGNVSGTILVEMRPKVTFEKDGSGKYAGSPTLKIYSVPEADVLLRNTLNKYEALLHEEWFITYDNPSDDELYETWALTSTGDIESMKKYKFNSLGPYLDEHWGVAIQEIGHLHCSTDELSPCVTESKESDTEMFFTKDDGTPDRDLNDSLKISTRNDFNVWDKDSVSIERNTFARIDMPSSPMFLVGFDIVSRHHLTEQIKTLMDRMIRELKQMGFALQIQQLVYDGYSKTLKTPFMISDKYKMKKLKAV